MTRPDGELPKLYDPATGTFTKTGAMTEARGYGRAVVLNDGRVLLAGGGDASTQIYDPATGTFKKGAAMPTLRDSTRPSSSNVAVE